MAIYCRIANVGGAYFTLTPACATGSDLDMISSHIANGTLVEIRTSTGLTNAELEFVKL